MQGSRVHTSVFGCLGTGLHTGSARPLVPCQRCPVCPAFRSFELHVPAILPLVACALTKPMTYCDRIYLLVPVDAHRVCRRHTIAVSSVHFDSLRDATCRGINSEKTCCDLYDQPAMASFVTTFMSGPRRNWLLINPPVVAKQDDALKFGILGAATIAWVDSQ